MTLVDHIAIVESLQKCSHFGLCMLSGILADEEAAKDPLCEMQELNRLQFDDDELITDADIDNCSR